MKSVAGFVVGLIGAIGSLSLFVILLVLYLLAFFGKSALDENSISNTLSVFASDVTMWLLVFAIWFLIIGVLGIIFSNMMNDADRARKGGVWCIVLGILGVNLFLFIGGIIGAIAGGLKEKLEVGKGGYFK